SVGTDKDATTLRDAVQAAQAAGVLIVAAAGNLGTEGVLYPAAYDNVLAVGSVNSEFRRSCFSSYGSELDLMAAGGEGVPRDPGTGQPIVDCDVQPETILSTIPGDDYGFAAGTSQATPVVSGVAALVWSQNPGMSAEEVAGVLKDSAYFDRSYMDVTHYGAGILRADNALGLLGPTEGGRNVSTTVTATMEGGDEGLDTVSLDLLLGTSDGFSISGLAAGSYTLEAATEARDGKSLAGSKVASPGENVTVRVGPAE
ncbi:MAG TPA: S8 family serine peptidase, partial [Trueperaceae bacterium]